MATGKVKSYDTVKGYGFITPQPSGKDIIVFQTAVQASGLKGLDIGQKLIYDVALQGGQPCAVNLRKSM